MKKTSSQEWVGQLAEGLLCEIINEMSGITLRGVPAPPDQVLEKEMAAVLGETVGDYRIQMQLKTEFPLFERLAEKMAGDCVDDEITVEEYATEFFNIVCGRFVSELYVSTGQSARFMPTTYERPPNITDLGEGGRVSSVCLMSDNSETAIFSWTIISHDGIL